MKQITFNYSIPKIREEVEKRTSYLGRMRNTDVEPHLLDRLSLTEGEYFLFDEYLRESVVETYNWVKAFGRNVPNACELLKENDTKDIWENYGIRVKMGGNVQPHKFIVPISEYEFIQLNPVVHSYAVKVKFSMPIIIDFMMDTTCIPLFRFYYRTNIPQTPIVDEHESTICGNVISKDCSLEELIYTGRSVITILKETPFGMPELMDVTKCEFEIIDVCCSSVNFVQDDYAAYHHFNGNIDYYLIESDCTNDDFLAHARNLGGDFRNSIVYRLELPEWVDDNMLFRVQNSLREALVNYVMWRWLEMVLPSEADVYLGKWETHVRNAQQGLNSEKKILNRKYKMF